MGAAKGTVKERDAGAAAMRSPAWPAAGRTHYTLTMLPCRLFFRCFWIVVLAASLCQRAAEADRVELADGRVLEGSFVLLSGVAVAPTADAAASQSAGTPILACDDQLKIGRAHV